MDASVNLTLPIESEATLDIDHRLINQTLVLGMGQVYYS